MKSNKKLITQIIESVIFREYALIKAFRCGLEVAVINGGRVDFAAMKGCDVVMIEIKTSLSDFKSKNGHNFYGNKNYYAITKELHNQLLKKDLIKKIDNHIGIFILEKKKNELCGVFNYYLKNVKRAKKIKCYYDGWEAKKSLKEDILTATNSTIIRLLKPLRINVYDQELFNSNSEYCRYY